MGQMVRALVGEQMVRGMGVVVLWRADCEELVGLGKADGEGLGCMVW